MDDELRSFYDEVLICLSRYGGLSNHEARKLLDESHLFDVASDAEKDALMHEYPYYWAMHLIHSKQNPNWHQNPNLWPPPADYLDKNWL